MSNEKSNKTVSVLMPGTLLLWLSVLLSTTPLPADEPNSDRHTPGTDDADAADSDANKQRLREVIERLRENERLYADIDFTLRRSYRHVGQDRPEDAASFIDALERFVYQDGYFYFQKLSQHDTGSHTRTTAFDGRQTIDVSINGPDKRFGQPDIYASILDSRIPGGHAVYPHTIVLGDNFIRGMLSEYLTQTRTSMDRPVRTQYVGETDIDELRCETVKMRFFEVPDAEGFSKPMGGFMIWLAVDRNYLPVRVENDGQSWERRITEMFELEPGVSFPRRTEDVSYEWRDGQRVLRNLSEIETVRVKLNPEYAIAFFQNVKVPYEAHVNEVHDGETVRSYVSDQRYPVDSEYLNLQNTETDERLPTTLRGLRQLQSLDLAKSPISGLGLAALSQTPHLRSLTLNATPITDAGLEYLRLVPELETLQLEKTKISDAGLAHLAPLKSLRFLSLEQCEQITGVGLKSVGEAAPLADLRLTGCSNVGDAAMEHIGRIRSLTHLFLSGTAVGDAGLARLSTLENLEYLQIENCPNVTDEGLTQLSQLPRLQTLFVGGCPHVTDEGVARLQAARPNFRIRR
jgi:hypothetical protein